MMRYQYFTYDLHPERVSDFLNDLERLASGHYDILKISDERFDPVREQRVCQVIIRIYIEDVDPLFDEAEIKRKLGL